MLTIACKISMGKVTRIKIQVKITCIFFNIFQVTCVKLCKIFQSLPPPYFYDGFQKTFSKYYEILHTYVSITLLFLREILASETFPVGWLGWVVGLSETKPRLIVPTKFPKHILDQWVFIGTKYFWTQYFQDTKFTWT